MDVGVQLSLFASRVDEMRVSLGEHKVELAAGLGALKHSALARRRPGSWKFFSVPVLGSSSQFFSVLLAAPPKRSCFHCGIHSDTIIVVVLPRAKRTTQDMRQDHY